MSANQSNNPFDKRVLFVVILFFFFYIGWQNHLNKKYPDYGKTPNKVASETVQTGETTGVKETSTMEKTQIPEKVTALSDSKKANLPEVPEKTYSYESESVEFQLSSKGMGIVAFKVKKYQNKDKTPVIIGQGSNQKLFEMRIGQNKEIIDFEIESLQSGQYIGRAKYQDMTIERHLNYTPESNSFTNEIIIKNLSKEALSGISFFIPDKIHLQENNSFLFPSFEFQDFFISHSGTSERVSINHSKENIHKDFKLISILSLGTQYFSSVIMDKSEIAPEASINTELSGKTALAELIYRPVAGQPEMHVKQILFVGPKSIDTLKKIDAKMAQIFDFGWIEWMAIPLLYTMKWFHTVVPNWGLAIILLTLFVRLVVLPFNVMSIRSMKAMQKIQPMINSLRERYKSDPLKLNQEMMALMKEHKANPLGGCLPMLIQIPIFFALYRVIGSSIELYQSPFALWIQDLSSPDKFYVLPILMGLTMYVQQKITPTTMDPTQAKIMAFLPLVFSLFMLQLPSGLTLYMFISALFGIIQQWILLRERKA